MCSAEELENYAKDGELDDYWFLKDVKRGDKYCLEGSLFPDSRMISHVNSSAEGALEKMLDNFDARFDDEMKASVDTLNERFASMLRNNGYGDDYIAEHRLSVRDVVTIASLVEKETAGKDESPNIASVIYNRLSNQSEWPYLNIDAALLYAIGHRDVISESDKNMDTPYNTYKYQGLIPGPIANPGMVSLKAALIPAIPTTIAMRWILPPVSIISPKHWRSTMLSWKDWVANNGKNELLSPAGDMERLEMAVLYGADAVYLAGTSFGMRSFAGNFSTEELPKAVRYAHDHGKSM